MEINRITIIRQRKPLRRDINEELQWLGSSLGLFSLRDRDRSCFRIFIELLKTTKAGSGASSDEIAYRLNLSRGTVVHHLKKLGGSGLITMRNKRYILRVDSLTALVEEVKKDVDRIHGDLREVAEDIDRKLGL